MSDFQSKLAKLYPKMVKEGTNFVPKIKDYAATAGKFFGSSSKFQGQFAQQLRGNIIDEYKKVNKLKPVPNFFQSFGKSVMGGSTPVSGAVGGAVLGGVAGGLQDTNTESTNLLGVPVKRQGTFGDRMNNIMSGAMAGAAIGGVAAPALSAHRRVGAVRNYNRQAAKNIKNMPSFVDMPASELLPAAQKYTPDFYNQEYQKFLYSPAFQQGVQSAHANNYFNRIADNYVGSGPRGLVGNAATGAANWLRGKGWTGSAGAVQYVADLFTGDATKAGASVALKTLKDIQFANPQLAAKLDIANVNLHEIPPEKLIAQIRYAFTLPSLTPGEKGMLAAGMQANGIRLNQKTLNFAYDTAGNYAGKNKGQILDDMFTGRFKGSPQDIGVISNYQRNLIAEARANLSQMYPNMSQDELHKRATDYVNYLDQTFRLFE